MRRVCASSLILSLLVASIISAPASNASNYSISDRGEEAIEQIATCINSDGKNQLNILYLIDESGSLRWNDKENLRVQGIKRSLEQFRDVSLTKPYFSINRAITTFGSSFTVQKNWEKLSEGSLENDLNWIDKNIPDLNRGKFTDWEKGLEGALQLFQQVKAANTCNVMVWFTDGGIQVGANVESTRASLERICGANPVTGKKSNDLAIIDKFRRAGINIQGVLLRNQKYIDNPSEVVGSEVSKQDLDNELARMSFFLPVVEQSGGVSGGAFVTGGPSSFSCGTNEGAGGVLQVVDDAIDIIWPPIQFNCLADNGRIIPIGKSGDIKVDAALTRFTLTSPSSSFTLKNSSGAEVANSRGASKGDVQVTNLGNSSSIVQVTGKINSSNSVTKPGVWKVNSSDIESAVFCGFIDLDVNVSAGTCYVGEKCDYSGVVTRFRRPIDLNSFQSVRVSASQLNSIGKPGSSTPLSLNESTGEFSSSFMPQGEGEIANLKIGIKVVTQTGIEFSLGTVKPIRVIPPGYYPEISPAPIKASDFSENLIGKRGEALVNLTLKGPSRTNGQVCLGPLEVRSDVNPNRINNYESAIDGKRLDDQACFTVLAGSTKVVPLTIKNSESADGMVSGYVSAKLKSDGKLPIDTKVDIQFASETQVDDGKFYSLLALFMFLGIALPLALLSVINSRNSRLVLDSIYLASVPVTLTSSGNFVNVARAENSKSSALLAQEDFTPFSSGKEVVRTKMIGSETLRGITPKNPFGMLKAQLTTAVGQTIASSAISHGKSKFASNQTHGALNPSGLVYVTLSDAALEQLKLENQGSRESSEPIEGSLTALLSLNTGDPVAQVDYLNTRIMHEGGWLNNLLSVVPAITKPDKPSKLKKSRKKETLVPQATAVQDEWGSPTSNPGTNTSTGITNSAPLTEGKTNGDDWGSSSTSSDWDSPGSSGSSKEEW
jgi:hypothetical protein